MQTILGAGGAISNELIKELIRNKEPFRLVSRNPKRSTEATEVVAADIMNAASVSDAVKGSEVVHLLVGLQYNLKLWQKQWPVIMKNVIEACKRHHAKLIFFDNVYAYGLVKGAMTEEIAFNPCSRKGEVRATIASMLLNEVRNGSLTATIARAADFYGPDCEKGFLNFMVGDNYAKGKSAQYMISDQPLHSFTFTPDAGKAIYLLSKNNSSFNQTWHIPTASPAVSGKKIIELCASAFGVPPKKMILKKWMIWMYGFFDGNVKEVYEMLYQNENDYIFDSSKFEKTFGILPTSYEEGINLMAESYHSIPGKL